MNGFNVLLCNDDCSDYVETRSCVTAQGRRADAVKKCLLCTVACENNGDNGVSMMIREKARITLSGDIRFFTVIFMISQWTRAVVWARWTSLFSRE